MSALFHDGRPFTLAHAEAMGLSRHHLYRLVSDRVLDLPFAGVFVDAKVPDSRERRLAALALVAPKDAVVCNESAAWLHGVNTYKPSERFVMTPSIVVPHATTRATLPGVRCRQAILPSSDVTEIGDLKVTTPLRTTSDLLRRLYRPYALAAADGMARAGLVSFEDVVDYVHRLKGYPGIRQARQLAVLIEPRAASPGESWHRLRVIDAGFPIPEVQYPVVDGGGIERYLDLAYPDLLVGSEYDGREFHTLEEDVEHDGWRRSDLEKRLGWRFVIAKKQDIFGEDMTFERELGAFIGKTPRPRSWGTLVKATRR